MKFYTVKNENIFTVKCDDGEIVQTIGSIEKPYHHMDIYVAQGWNHETLGNEGSFIFSNFNAAQERIITHYKNEMEVLRG